MNAIYAPAPRAAEYAPLACNIYAGCVHGCTYCYAPAALHRTRESFHAQATERPGLLDALERDAQKLAGDPRPVLLCFSTDPYQPGLPRDGMATREAIQILGRHGLTPVILSKGGMRALPDFALMHEVGAWFGQTLGMIPPITGNPHHTEPKAAPTFERWAALARARRLDIPTWASLEPVINPAHALHHIRTTHEFVDHYKIGKINYAPTPRGVDWPWFVLDAVALLEGLGFTRETRPGVFSRKTYYLKKDLVEAI